ncbi:hypothetical protein M23134_00221 [Microscilla marina ATCC 23134]|uniref:Uncharacterized protein n=1 Tax=Microscilla marina ATCC 23134 TaxID=313606 RepID=A1ZNY9_MICM2|nr:hypothetical protein M23134_00221 [Microscilla marina ATCC 23134]
MGKSSNDFAFLLTDEQAPSIANKQHQLMVFLIYSQVNLIMQN